MKDWPDWLAGHAQARKQLVEAYADPGRGYHDLQHLREVLERIDEILAADGDGVDRDAVLLAAWFHDAVYDSAGNLEERSAVLAEQVLARTEASDALVDEVARLVRLTATHQPEEADLNGQVLCDSDLAILAADAPRYREYVDGVRREYAHVDDDAFRAGRAAILHELEAKPTLFHTGYARKHWETAARENLSRELTELEQGDVS
jgi:predicted metal-dependent HD superfamily phosphohydrolase